MRALVLALCLTSCGSFMDAYRIETARCAKKGDAEDIRKCQSLVDKRFGKYFAEGEYPKRTTIGELDR